MYPPFPFAKLVFALGVAHLSFCLIESPLAAAEETNEVTRVMSLNECLIMALQHNLDLQIERHSPQIARYRLGSAYGIYEPSLNLSAGRSFLSQPGTFDLDRPGTHFPYELTTDSFGSGLSGRLPTGLTYDLAARSDRWDATTDFRLLAGGLTNFPPNGFRSTNEYFLSTGLTLRQPLLKNFWIDSDRLQVQVQKKNLKISEMALRGRIMSTITAVELAYYELIFSRENYNIQRAALEASRQLVNETRTRVQAGQLGPLEATQTEAQMELVQTDMVIAEQVLDEGQDRLRNLLMDDLKDWFGARIEASERLSMLPPAFDKVASWQRAMNSRPDWLQFKLDLEKQDIVLRFNRNQLFPSLDLAGTLGYKATDNGFDVALGDIRDREHSYYSYGVVLTIPLGNKTARDNYRAEREAKKQALLRMKKLELEILTEVESAGKLMESTYKRLSSTRKTREYAALSLKAEQDRVANGTSTRFTMLQFQRRLTEAQVAEIRALADYNKARAQLAFSEASTLEGRGIDLNFK